VIEGSRILREHSVASVPTIRIRDRIGVDVPAITVPADAHGTQHPVPVQHVEDVGVAIGEKHASFAILLLAHEVPDGRESRLFLAFTKLFTQRSQDGCVYRVLEQLAVGEVGNTRPTFHLGHEPFLEVVAEVGNLRDSRRLGIDHEVLAGSKPTREGDADAAEEVEDLDCDGGGCGCHGRQINSG